jgi:hypothetical protein
MSASGGWDILDGGSSIEAAEGVSVRRGVDGVDDVVELGREYSSGRLGDSLEAIK